MRLVLRDGFHLALPGLVLGFLGAMALVQVVTSVAVGIDAKGPFTFALALLLELGVICAACLSPAHRASKVDPLISIRAE